MKNRLTGLLIAACLLSGNALAQTPKWYKKAQKSLLSIVTFDENNNILASGNGFLVDDEGTALANFGLFKGAYKAKVVDSNGKEYEVKWICGASSLYDVVKFRLDAEKSQPGIKVAEKNAEKGELVYLLPYATQKKKDCKADSILDISLFKDKYHYYTLSGTPNKMMVNVPVMNSEGEAIAMLQSSSDEQKNYAISIRFGSDLATNALSASDNDLNAIHIAKMLPEEETDATTFLYLTSSNDSLLYVNYLNQYLEKFPKKYGGYSTAADFYSQRKDLKTADKYMQQGMEKTEEKDQLHYAWSKLIYNLNMTPGYEVYSDWNMERALDEAQKAYQSRNLPIYLVQQGNCFYALHKYQEAYNVYTEANKTNLKSSEIYLYAAQCKKMLEAPLEEILALQDSALSLYTKPYKSEAAPVLLARANTYIEMKEYKKAVVDLNEYESLNYGNLNANFYYLRSQAELNGKMYELAVNDIDKATKLEPKNPLLWAQKAGTLYGVGLIKEAIEAARKSIELNPAFADAHRILGVCLIQNDQKEEGVTALKKAKELGDNLAESLINNIK